MFDRQAIKGGLLAASALLVLGAARLDAQSVEAMLRAGEELALTEQQVQQLDQIRRETVSERNAERALLAELRSQLAAGQIRRSQLMAAMEEQQDARQARAAERRASIEAILTAEQLESVQQMGRRGDGRRAGPGRARPGFGRGGPDFGPGGRQGFAPEGGSRERQGFARSGRRGGPGGPGGPTDLDALGDDADIGLR